MKKGKLTLNLLPKMRILKYKGKRTATSELRNPRKLASRRRGMFSTICPAMSRAFVPMLADERHILQLFLEIIGKKVKKRPVFPKKAEKKQNH